MKLLKNSGTDRVVDELRRSLVPQGSLDIATPAFSLFAFGELQQLLGKLERCRLVLPSSRMGDPGLLGAESDRSARNRLQARSLAKACEAWLQANADVKTAPGSVPQSTLSIGSAGTGPTRVITGTCSFTTDGLGITPSANLRLIQVAESPEECTLLGGWFAELWNSLPASAEPRQTLLTRLGELTAHRGPSLVYFLTLYHLFKDLGDELDEERIVKSATGIRNTIVWKKLFKFQRDGVVGAIDKLEPLRRLHHRRQRGPREDLRGAGDHQVLRAAQRPRARPRAQSGCATTGRSTRPTTAATSSPRTASITTFSTIPTCPATAASRATSTSRTSTGATTTSSSSTSPTTSATRRPHARTARRATTASCGDHQGRRQDPRPDALRHAGQQPPGRPKNQIAFVTEGDDTASPTHGIRASTATIRKAQKQFNRWLALEDADRTSGAAHGHAGLRLLQAARPAYHRPSRKHIEKYYGTAETGRSPNG